MVAKNIIQINKLNKELKFMETVSIVIQNYLDTFDAQLEQLKDAIDSNNMDVSKRIGRTLKGGAENVLAHNVQQAAESLSSAGVDDACVVYKQLLDSYIELLHFLDDQSGLNMKVKDKCIRAESFVQLLKVNHANC